MQCTLILALIAVLFAAAPVRAVPPDAPTWHAALQQLRRELPARHPAPFLHVTIARWDSAADDLDRRLPTLTRDQRLVGFMELVAMLGDAHTVLEPDSTFGLRFYPIELYSFDDGLFVRRADPAHAALVGARVVRIGNVTAEQAMARVGDVIPHENEWWVRAFGPADLAVPEIVDGLGLTADPENLPLVVERSGQTATVRVKPAGRMPGHGHGHGLERVDMHVWTSMRGGPAPEWERHPDQPLWWEFDAASRTLYVCQRAVAPAPGLFTNQHQWDQVFDLADSLQPARFVIDIRENTGGNWALNRYPVQQILRRPALDRPDRLFVIIGRRTFSAGQQFANLLEAWTQATFVGEPTGQRPSQYGDHRPLALAGTGLTVQISSIFHQAPNEFDARSFVPPHAYTPLDSRSYARGADPAMAAVQAPDPSAHVAETIEQLLAAGDSTRAERLLADARDRPRNRFLSFERDVNAIGYRLLAAGHTDRALVAFRMNARTFPASANTYDSLGEALLAAGYRDAAVSAYHQALAVQPGFPPSAEALQRLESR